MDREGAQSRWQYGPLSGFRVLEMGSTIAGPFCGRLLADFGAEVIKVEGLEGDAVRFMGKRLHEKSLYAASIFRNKFLIALDLRSSKGQEIVKRLISQTDIVVENFRPGGLERWSLGYQDLSAINPGLIMVRISGYGQSGPYRGRPGYGVTSEAMSGLRHVTGDPDRPPARIAVSLTDYITGLYGALGAVMALLVRAQSGRGQCIDAALYECAFSFMEPHVPAYDKLGIVAMRAGSRLPDHTPNNLYATGDNQFIHIVAASDAIFKRLAGVMGCPELVEDARFASPLARAGHADEVDEVIARWTTAHPVAELEKLLVAAEIPAARIFTMADIFNDAQYRARNMLDQVPDDDLGSVTVTGVVPRLSETPGSLRWTGGCTGRDTREVLSKLAGLTESQLAELEAAGVIRMANVKRRQRGV
jgi:crotonobetainyl-CoA:carnitine CoA-transferase CaiB-like acyl-CoA transferase